MPKWLRRWWMQQCGRTCRHVDRECEMEIARAVFYVSPDGQAYRVRRLACTYCGRRSMTARRERWYTPETDGVAVHGEGTPWEDAA